jgi:hypothetical protein
MVWPSRIIHQGATRSNPLRYTVPNLGRRRRSSGYNLAISKASPLDQDARRGPNEQTPSIELGQVHGRIMDIERVQLLAILRVAFQAKARVIDGLAGSIDARGTPRNQMHDWFAAGIKPIAGKRKSRPIARLQIEDPFEKASGAFKIGRAQREGLHLKEFVLLLSSTGLAYRRCELAWVNGDQIGAKIHHAA